MGRVETHSEEDDEDLRGVASENVENELLDVIVDDASFLDCLRNRTEVIL